MDMPGHPGFGGGSPWWAKMLQPEGPNPNAPTPNAGETPQEMFARFQNDYHSPDKDQVMDTMKDSNYYGTRMHMLDGAGGGGIFGKLGNTLAGSIGGGVPQSGGMGGAMDPLIQQLLARKTNGGQ